MALRLSVLDQTPVSEGSTAAQALRNSIDLAQLTDRLGYHRYWVAEHHGGELVAYGAEEAIVVTITHDHEARRRSYELLAAEFGLEAEPSAAAPTVPESAGRTS